MPPRRIQFTQADIDAQLQQIHLLDPSSTNENLESFVPLMKQVHDNHQIEAFLRTTQGLVDAKDKEIEAICGDNYQDFVSSVSTLLTVRSYTENLRERIQTLDSSVSAVGTSFASKKKALLQSKKTATNLDEAIDTLQACLRVLDLVNRVGDMIKEQRYWSALKALEDIESLPQSSLSQSPFFIYLLSSLPSLRTQIKEAVISATNTWLAEIRSISGDVGRLASEAMKTRVRRWKTKREREPFLKLSLVGSPVELVTNEKAEYRVLDNDQLKVDFKPLYQCIHIYTALESVEELQRTYQADRKRQGALILSDRLSTSSSSRNLANVLAPLTEDIIGFFVIESHVLKTTRSFRSQREVDELWDILVARLIEVVQEGLKDEEDVDTFLASKDIILSFIQTLEGYDYETEKLRSLMLILFESYSALLDRKFSADLKQAVNDDDQVPMQIENSADLDRAVSLCYLRETQKADLLRSTLPVILPFSHVFYASCACIREFVDKFYSFIEGVSHHHRDIDELLRKALDQLLTKHVSDTMSSQLSSARNVSQIAQLIINIEYFQLACSVLEQNLMKLRAAQRGGSIRLLSYSSFSNLHSNAVSHLTTVINAKLSQFFEMAEYDWTPGYSAESPNGYLWEMTSWLTTVVDGLGLRDQVRVEIFKGALKHIADGLMEFLTGSEVPSINENGIRNLLVDVDFLEDEFRKLGEADISNTFAELRETANIPLNDEVGTFLTSSSRQSRYTGVQPRRLAGLLEKMARYGYSSRSRPEQEKAERRKAEAQAVARLPG